jgi:hypothetical protein
MIIFEGDYVRLVNEDNWVQVKEIIPVSDDYAENKMGLSDGYIVPAPVESYVAEVRSAGEHAKLSEDAE